MPFTDKWWKIGWNDSELKKIESKLECTQDSLSDVEYSDTDFYAEYNSDSVMLIDYSLSDDESHSSMKIDVSESLSTSSSVTST